MKKPFQGKTLERRNGLEGFAWEGIATKVDPAGSPPNRPRDLINTRIQGGVIISRPGFQGEGGYVPLAPIHDLDTPDATENPQYEVLGVKRLVPHWLADHGSAAGVRLWCVSEPDTPNTFSRLNFLDTDGDRAFQSVAVFRSQNVGFAVPIEKFNNEFYYGDFAGLRKLYLVPSREGASSPPISTNHLAEEIIVSYPGFITMALQEHEGALYFVISDGVVGEIFAWSGLSVTPEFTLATPGIAGVSGTTYKDTLVFAVRDYVGAGQGSLLIRDAAGTWTAATLAGFNPTRLPNGIAEYGDLLYIMDGNTKIFTWDGTTIVDAFTLPVGGSALNVCAKLSGRLYFSWIDGGNTRAELGFVDQDNNAASRFTANGTRAGIFPGNFPAMAMAAYRGRLWVSIDNSSGEAVILWHSQQFMPYDSWQQAGSGTDVNFSAEMSMSAGITNMRTL